MIRLEVSREFGLLVVDVVVLCRVSLQYMVNQ